MIIPKNWLNYYVYDDIYHNMKKTYHNHDIEDYIDYHDMYIAHHYSIVHVLLFIIC